MTSPAFRPASSLDVRNIFASTIEVDDLAKLGDTNGSGVGFYGTPPTNQTQTLTVPVDASGGPLGAFTDPPTAPEMAALRTFVNNLGASLSTNKTSLNEIRQALGNLTGVGLVDLTP